MRYSNRDSFILSAPGAMGMEPCSLEAIMAGTAAGARGCVLPVDTTKDGITLVCSEGCYRSAQTGETLTACDHTFESLRAAYPKIVSFGQALELAKASSGGLSIELHHHQAAAQVRVSLKYSEYVDNAYFCGLSLPDAGRLAARYPDLQVMADIHKAPDDPIAFVREVQDLRLFGVRGTPEALTEALCNEALRCGLFLASTDSSDPDTLRRMLAQGVNFIETSRPDLAVPLLTPPETTEPEEIFVPFSDSGAAFIPYDVREAQEQAQEQEAADDKPLDDAKDGADGEEETSPDPAADGAPSAPDPSEAAADEAASVQEDKHEPGDTPQA